MRLKHYSIRTERSYGDWIRRYIGFHKMRSREDLNGAEPKIEQFLSDLAVNGHVSASTQNQADLDAQQRFGAIGGPRMVRSASAWLPMGCAEGLAMRLPANHNDAARDTLSHRPRSACGPRRSLAGHSPDTRRSTSYRR